MKNKILIKDLLIKLTPYNWDILIEYDIRFGGGCNCNETYIESKKENITIKHCPKCENIEDIIFF